MANEESLEDFEKRLNESKKHLAMEGAVETKFSLPNGEILADDYEIKLLLMQKGFEEKDADDFIIEWNEAV